MPAPTVKVCISVRMARLNVYVPDDLAARARSRGLNISALTQAAISAELADSATAEWLAEIPVAVPAVTHDAVMDAIDSARADMGA